VKSGLVHCMLLVLLCSVYGLAFCESILEAHGR